MGDSAYIGQLFAGLCYLIVGSRLFRLASRTGEKPERALAWLFILAGTSYVVYTMALIPGLESLWTPISFAARAVYLPAPVCLAIFTRQVFRSDDRWSAWMVYLVAALMLGGVGGSILSGDWEGFSIGNPWFWLEWAGYTIPFGWAGVEAIADYRPSLRRLRLGLCDPLVPNRLLLWSLYGVAQVSISIFILPQYMEFEQQNTWGASWDRVVGVFETVSVLLIGFVFFPPAFYRNWVIGGDVDVANTVEGN
jgi:hypothetical protein